MPNHGLHTEAKPVGVFRVVVAPSSRFRSGKDIRLARFGRVKPTVMPLIGMVNDRMVSKSFTGSITSCHLAHPKAANP